MAELYAQSRKPISLYKDRRYGGDLQEREQKLRHTTTLYVGNLSFYTREEQIFDLFSRVGEVKRIIMGLDRIKKTPCGFCFVEYFTRQDAEKSVHFLSGMKLDERTIRVDYDIGYSPGRQYGRGRSGGQVRDEYRADYDPGRGGFGKAMGPQTGMSGMDMWGPQGPPPGPAPIHHFPPPGVPFNVQRGRGRPRGRGRFRGGPRGGRSGGPGPRYFDNAGMGEGNFGPPPGHGMKRRRDFEGGPPFNPGENDYQMPKRARFENGEGNGMGPGPDVRASGSGMPMDTTQDADGRLNGSEPARNARFDRGKKDEGDDVDDA